MPKKIFTLVSLAICFFFAAVGSAVEPDGRRYVIIHADDAGMSHSVHMATIDAMEKGIVSSASIMVPCPWFKEIAAYAKAHPEKDFGIHLTLNCEWKNYRWGPVAPRESVPSLVDEEGYMWDGVPQVVAGAKAAEVETELRAQIQRALDFGVPVTHLDTHMGAVVSRPDLIGIYVKLGIEFDVPVFFIRALNVGIAGNPEIRARGLQLVDMLDKHKLPVLDYMTQYYTKESFEKKKNAPARPKKAAEVLPMTGSGSVSALFGNIGGYFSEDDVRRITFAAARGDAVRLVTALLSEKALPMSTANTKAGVAKRYDEITAMVDKLTVKLFYDTATGRTLESIEDEGKLAALEAELPEDAGEPAEGETVAQDDLDDGENDAEW